MSYHRIAYSSAECPITVYPSNECPITVNPITAKCPIAVYPSNECPITVYPPTVGLFVEYPISECAIAIPIVLSPCIPLLNVLPQYLLLPNVLLS